MNKIYTRRTRSVNGYPGIYRIEVSSQTGKRWTEPTRGSKFGVKISRTVLGKVKEIRRQFEKFEDAKAFWINLQTGELPASLAASAQMNFSLLVQRWIETSLPNKKPSTQARYLSYLKHFEALNDIVVEKIRVTDIDSLIAIWKSPKYLANGNATRCDYRHEFSLLRSILHFYAERFNRSYVMPFIRGHSKDICVRTKLSTKKDLTPEQYHLFLKELKKVCEGKWEPIFYLAQFQYWLYARVQEAAAVYFEDFDFQTNRVSINKRVVWLRTKNTLDYVDNGLKAGDRKVIPISSMLATLHKEWSLKSGKRTGLMFTVDDELIAYRQIEYRYSLALKQALLPFTGTHVLRHASLTDLYANSHDILVVRDLAGHSDVKTTQQYASVREDAKDDAVQKHSETHFNLANRTQSDAK